MTENFLIHFVLLRTSYTMEASIMDLFRLVVLVWILSWGMPRPYSYFDTYPHLKPQETNIVMCNATTILSILPQASNVRTLSDPISD